MLSIIIPVHNGCAYLRKTIDAVLSSDYRDYEILVVDDASTDESADIVRARGVEVIPIATKLGPAAARNQGARHARGDILLFVDADVLVQPNTLTKVVKILNDNPDVAAVFGSYDDSPSELNFISQFKNLSHHFVHQHSSRAAATFWAGCGAIRRRVFETTGGFDESKYSRPSIEDIELGNRLCRKGFRIVLEKDLQVKHLKRWTLSSMVKSDIFSRAWPWSRLILEANVIPNDLNLRTHDRLSAILVWLCLVSIVLSFFFPVLIVGAALGLIVVAFLNRQFYQFLIQRRGLGFALRSFAMKFLFYLYSSSVFVLCYGAHLARKMFAPFAARESPVKDS